MRGKVNVETISFLLLRLFLLLFYYYYSLPTTGRVDPPHLPWVYFYDAVTSCANTSAKRATFRKDANRPMSEGGRRYIKVCICRDFVSETASPLTGHICGENSPLTVPELEFCQLIHRPR